MTNAIWLMLNRACACTCVYMCTCVPVCTRVCMRSRAHVFADTCVHTRVLVCTPVHVCVHTRVRRDGLCPLAWATGSPSIWWDAALGCLGG